MSSPMFPRCLNFFFVSLTPIASGHGTLSEEGKLGETQNQQYVFRVNIVDSQGDSSPKLLKHTATVVFLRPAWSPQLETDSIRPCAVPAHRYSWLAIYLVSTHSSPLCEPPPVHLLSMSHFVVTTIAVASCGKGVTPRC